MIFQGGNWGSNPHGNTNQTLNKILNRKGTSLAMIDGR